MILTVNKKKLCDNELVHAGFRLCEEINRFGYEAYLVGGCVRDMLMNEEVHDADVATNMPIDELKDKFYWHDNNGEKHGTILVNFTGHYIETTQFRADGKYSDGRHPDSVEFSKSFEEDTKRRDFTINAIGIDYQGTIVDFQNGQADIEQRVIRAVGNAEERFNEDALRMIRAIRFAARFNFSIEQHTYNAISKLKHNINFVARERIGEEIKKAASYGAEAFERFISLLNELNVSSLISQSLINFDDAQILLHRYNTEPKDDMPMTKSESVDLLLCFVLAHAKNVQSAVTALRYDNKLLSLLKFIKQYQYFGITNVFGEKVLAQLVKASTSKHFSVFLNYMRTFCLFKLSDAELYDIAQLAHALEDIHEFVAEEMQKLGYSGVKYGEVLNKFTEWYCYRYRMLRPTEQEIIEHLRSVA